MSNATTKEVLGYGFIPKQVMDDERLTIESKAIYSYLAAYAGSDGYAYPSLELITKKLKITKNRFYKHLNLLIQYGYVVKQQTLNEKNKYDKVFYFLVPFPQNEETNKIPFPYFPYTGNRPQTNNNITNNNINNINNNIYIPFPQNEETEEYSKNQTSEAINNNPFLQNEETITNPLFKGEEIELNISDDTDKSKKRNNKKDKPKIKYAEYVSMTEQQYNLLIQKYGEEKTKRMIEVLDNYKGAKGKQYKDDYRAILMWVAEKVEEEFKKKYKKIDFSWEEVFNDVK
ncbi:helix-turn-helix domain-containing protein [Caloramator sp. Dgby_cultured_2]|uniref:helix-turn-helix domain-containing protein n=1 Tax=Caloramator sp. Dgby_cultured_2 TaxID=3029174 RepID=UPI00237E8825|nr:helix-turn-helix domain-containing protein [Caloramator sp. Dgby_cultured_2]WDU82814.1 helix-turn-helix domain-containing protein [Caloramator sp. Dgby_cultured_2]